MRLSVFIRSNIEIILQEWEDFASTLEPLVDSTRRQLRDHAQQMLMVICADLDTYQCAQESIDKSQGNAPPELTATAAEIHAADRLESGFAIEELMAEYRALRASVLRLWQRTERGADELAVQDMLRFNEAIDQSLTESVARYSAIARESQNVFLAILGHDVRNPLGAISMGAQTLRMDPSLSEKHHVVAGRMLGSARRVTEIVEDLIDFSTSRLGRSMPIAPAPMEAGSECQQVVEEMRTLHPQRTITFEQSGNLQVEWDRARIDQALSNLIANAIQHGEQGQPVWVTIDGAENITITVQNQGEVIAPGQLRTLFDPSRQFAVRTDHQAGGNNLGLGLFITRDIVAAHGGAITVSSTAEEGTAFTVTLPRQAVST